MRTELQKGIAGEHLVCSDTHNQGYSAHIIGNQENYDIILNAHKLIKIQVKTSNYSEPDRFENYISFVLCRKSPKGVLGEYKNIDMFAFVWLKEKKIAYFHPKECGKYKKRINKTRFEGFPLDRALSILMSN